MKTILTSAVEIEDFAEERVSIDLSRNPISARERQNVSVAPQQAGGDGGKNRIQTVIENCFNFKIMQNYHLFLYE
jgi:hypothetical protein